MGFQNQIYVLRENEAWDFSNNKSLADVKKTSHWLFVWEATGNPAKGKVAATPFTIQLPSMEGGCFFVGDG